MGLILFQGKEPTGGDKIQGVTNLTIFCCSVEKNKKQYLSILLPWRQLLDGCCINGDLERVDNSRPSYEKFHASQIFLL